MSNHVILIGAGGHAKVIFDMIQKRGDMVTGFLDDYQSVGKIVLGVPVLGKISQWKEYRKNNKFVIAIGDNKVRKQIAERIQAEWYTAINTSAKIGLSVAIGEGSVIMGGSIVNSDAKIGKHVIINSGAIVEHDNQIKDYVHISPNATLAGGVQIGECTQIGIGAVVKEGIIITSNVTVGAGSAVVHNINANGTYAGVPARKLII